MSTKETANPTLDSALSSLTMSKHERRAKGKAPAAKGKGAAHWVAVIIRESAKKSIRDDGAGLTEFQKVADMTLTRNDVKDLPGAQQIKGMAVDLVRTGARADDLRQKMGAEAIVNGRIVVGYKIVIDHVIYILCVDSAAKAIIKVSDDLVNLNNAFTLAVARLVNQYRIKELYVGRFDRLVRHQQVMNDLINALTVNGTIVYSDSGPFNMATETGADMFRISALAGEKSYTSVVALLSNGWYALCDNGQWPKSEAQLPALGYKFRADDDPTVVPDLSKQELIKDLITWAADDNLSDYDIAKLLAEKHSLTSTIQASRQKGEPTLITDLRYPQTAVRNLLKRGLPIWATGKYSYKAVVPYHLKDEKVRQESQTKIEIIDENTRQITWEIAFHHEDLPNGQWVDEALILKALNRLTKREEKAIRGRGASLTDERKPLAGVSEWIEGDTQYALSARHSRNYHLIARPAENTKDSQGRALGWSDEDRKNIIAVINPAETHSNLVEAAVAKLEAMKFDWSRVSAPTDQTEKLAKIDAERLPELAEDLNRVDKEIQDAEFDYRIAREERLDERARESAKLIERKRREHQAIQDRIAAAHNLINGDRLLLAGADVEVEGIAAMLAALDKTKNQAPGRLNLVLRNTISNLTFRLSDNNLLVNASFRLKLPTEDGILLTDEITFSVRNRRRDLKTERASTLLELFFRDGKTLGECAAEIGYTDLSYTHRQIAKELKAEGVVPSKTLRIALLECPLPEVRKVIWAEIESRRSGRAFRLPAGIDAGYAAQVRTAYSDPAMVWTLSWAADNPDRARSVIEMLEQSGGELPWDVVAQSVTAGVTARSSKHYIITEIISGKARQTTKSNRADYEAVVEKDGDIVRLRQCPHCGDRTLTHILRAPEVPGGMLCVKCRKTPTLPNATYPEGYLRRWRGGRGAGINWGNGPQRHQTTEEKI